MKNFKSKSGKEITLRYPKISDLKEVHRYANELSKEKTYVIFQGEKISLKAEEKWLKEALKNIKAKKEVGLSAFYKNKVIGVAGVKLSGNVEKHIGSFGISIAKDFRGEGIGQALMKVVEAESIKNLKELKIIILTVFENNPKAISLYKKLGYKEFGLLPEGIFYKNEYVGSVYMFKKVK